MNENFGESIVCSFDKKAIEINNNIGFQKIKTYTNSEYSIFHDYAKWYTKEHIKVIRNNINSVLNPLEGNTTQNTNIFQFNIKKAEKFIWFLDIAEIINTKNITADTNVIILFSLLFFIFVASNTIIGISVILL